MKLSAVLVPLVLCLARTASADCARVDNTADLITKDASVIPTDGGVLVGWKPLVNGPPNDAPARPAWTWNGGAPPAAIELAPHLVLYQPAGAVAIADATKTPLARFTRERKATTATLAAPRVTQLRLAITPIRYGTRRDVTATLTEAAPTEAVAIITYATRAKQQVALSYERIAKAGVLELATFADTGRCGFLPKGIEPPKVGESVTFAYVDQFGRRSKQSAPIKMVEAVRK